MVHLQKLGAFFESQEIPALETISFFQVPWLSFGLRNLTCFSKNTGESTKLKSIIINLRCTHLKDDMIGSLFWAGSKKGMVMAPLTSYQKSVVSMTRTWPFYIEHRDFILRCFFARGYRHTREYWIVFTHAQFTKNLALKDPFRINHGTFPHPKTSLTLSSGSNSHFG